MPEIGRKRWAIAEGYIPGESVSGDPALVSHETACILNATDRDAEITIIVFFSDREPAGPYRAVVPALQAGFRLDQFPVLLCWDRPFADLTRYLPISPGLL